MLTACGPGNSPTESQGQPIWGGTPVASGAWPAVAWLDNGCSGVLLTPGLVVFAAHCGTRVRRVWFGDQLKVHLDERTRTASAEEEAGVEFADVEKCQSHPEWGFGSGNDIAYCLLESFPIPQSAIVPPLLECERDALVPGATVTLVGYGLSEDDVVPGTKRSVIAAIDEVGRELRIGDAEHGTCAGDSGGPALIARGDTENPDWRVAGVLSSGIASEDCGVGYYTDLTTMVSWLEAASNGTLSTCASNERTCGGSGLDAEGVVIDPSDPQCAEETVVTPRGGCSLSPVPVRTDAPTGTWSAVWSALVVGWLRVRRQRALERQKQNPTSAATPR
jgi:hypothetical protein